MDKELQKILYNIQSETGISVNAVSLDGIISISTNDDFDYSLDKVFDDILSVEEENKTYFHFTFNRIKFLGVIDGSSIVEKNYVKFIISYLDSHKTSKVEMSYEEEFKAATKGELSRSRCAEFIKRYSIKSDSCYCMLVDSGNKKREEVLSFLNDYSTNGADFAFLDDEDTCYVKFIMDKDEQEFESDSEYIELMKRALYEETGIVARFYVGSKVGSFMDVSESYKSANSTKKLSSLFKIKGEILSTRDLVLVNLLEDIPKSRLEEIKRSLIDNKGLEIFKDEELLETGERFIECNLNMSETARVLYVHRNTLTYRLDKIEKITGLDIRKFNDALVLKIVLMSNKIWEGRYEK